MSKNLENQIRDGPLGYYQRICSMLTQRLKVYFPSNLLKPNLSKGLISAESINYIASNKELRWNPNHWFRGNLTTV